MFLIAVVTKLTFGMLATVSRTATRSWAAGLACRSFRIVLDRLLANAVEMEVPFRHAFGQNCLQKLGIALHQQLPNDCAHGMRLAQLRDARRRQV